MIVKINTKGNLKMRSVKTISMVIFIFLLNGCSYHVYKGMPEGTNYESEYYYHNEDEVDFLYDLTYSQIDSTKTDNNNIAEIKSEQEIFDTIFTHIDSAKTYILIDMFLFNSYVGSSETAHRNISSELSEKLIIRKSESDIKIDFITDPVNTVYGGAESAELNRMEEAGINIINTELKKLPDSNIIYSFFWRTFFQWFGNSKKGGILPHPFSSEEKNVTFRSYLTLLNFKANHRKVFVADHFDNWVTVITSANPHDGSSAHSNIGILIYGDFAEEIYKSETSVATFSKKELSSSIDTEREVTDKPLKIKLLTERRIKDTLLDEISKATALDSIKMGMFYLSDRDVVKSLISATNRGVDIKIILDPNKDAFGRKKNGIPNRPVAYELVKKSKGKIQIKWYATRGEQFHSKIIFFESPTKATTVIMGSANFTKRNIGNKNLEMNILLKADSKSAPIVEIHNYFEQIWNEEKYTVPYETYANKSLWKRFVYRFTEFWGASTY